MIYRLFVPIDETPGGSQVTIPNDLANIMKRYVLVDMQQSAVGSNLVIVFYFDYPLGGVS